MCLKVIHSKDVFFVSLYVRTFGWLSYELSMIFGCKPIKYQLKSAQSPDWLVFLLWADERY